MEMKKAIGVYLGWSNPSHQRWEPLLKIVRWQQGYRSDYTQIFHEVAKKYPGVGEVLELPVGLELPSIFRTRIPRVRPDSERECEFLGLTYPDIDFLEFIARDGGRVSGDPFDVCPIVTLNDQREYTFHCCLHQVNKVVKQQLSDHCTLEVSTKPIGQVVIADGQRLGLLPPYLSLLGDDISQVQLIKVSQDVYLGHQVLVSVTTSRSIYEDRCFDLAAGEALSV